MKVRKSLFWLCLVALVVVVGGQARTSKQPARDDVSLGLADVIAEHCTGDDGVAPSPRVTAEWCSMGVREIRLRAPGLEDAALLVLVAAESRQRQAGYQRIDATLVQKTATLFLFPRAIYGAFHMCNVEAPLWIVWYQEDGAPLDATRMLPGEEVPAADCEDVYSPRRLGWYRYALEIGEELARDLGLGQQDLATLRLAVEPWMAQGR